MTKKLFDAITSLSRNEALEITDELLQNNVNPDDILDTAREAMQVIGERFESGEYFLPELMVSGDILAAVAEKLKPLLEGEGDTEKIGKVVSPNQIIVQGAFRTQQTPNLDDGNIFIGNATTQATTANLYP